MLALGGPCPDCFKWKLEQTPVVLVARVAPFPEVRSRSSFGGGFNAVARMMHRASAGWRFYATSTDMQALNQINLLHLARVRPRNDKEIYPQGAKEPLARCTICPKPRFDQIGRRALRCRADRFEFRAPRHGTLSIQDSGVHHPPLRPVVDFC